MGEGRGVVRRSSDLEASVIISRSVGILMISSSEFSPSSISLSGSTDLGASFGGELVEELRVSPEKRCMSS
jgi:hypothetical protein